MPIKLAIAIMSYGGSIASQHAQMWLNFGRECTKWDVAPIHMHEVDINPVDRARNMAVANAMRANADWLLMVDADTFVLGDRPHALPKMIGEADHRGAAVVVAPVAARDDAGRAMIYRLQSGGGLHPATWANTDADIERGEPPLIMRIDSAAAAIMAINLHKIGDAIFKFVPPDGDNPGLSEDHAFCKQIREAGGTILVDTRVRTGHLKRPQVALSHG